MSNTIDSRPAKKISKECMLQIKLLWSRLLRNTCNNCFRKTILSLDWKLNSIRRQRNSLKCRHIGLKLWIWLLIQVSEASIQEDISNYTRRLKHKGLNYGRTLTRRFVKNRILRLNWIPFVSNLGMSSTRISNLYKKSKTLAWTQIKKWTIWRLV